MRAIIAAPVLTVYIAFIHQVAMTWNGRQKISIYLRLRGPHGWWPPLAARQGYETYSHLASTVDDR